MGKVSIGIAIAVLAALVGFSLAARAGLPPVTEPHLVSMEESAEALGQAGAAMQAHGQGMLDEAQRTSDRALADQGRHWRDDGQALVQRAQWLTMHPLAASSLVAPPAELSAQGSWGELPRTAEAMLHDPSKARSVDVEALRWNGLAMRAEGQNMAEHGRVMAEEAELMVRQHRLPDRDAAGLRQGAVAMREAGGHLSKNGDAMVEYAERLRRSIGYR